MNTQELIQARVHTYYRRDKLNCATATLKILSERFDLELHDQVIDASAGMHGAGLYRAQCGLVEGALMFLGILGKTRGFTKEQVIQACHDYARHFEARFGSLSCRVLRPEGFHPDQAPHICEPLTHDALSLDIEFVHTLLKEDGG